ncbi:hypothetical protein CK203_115015 [Vitis vinifera]|uniref:Retrovirus-related Pol polyprotein from transposon RE1 n=1 Tax=Vitis vinifera TaxID=29760 RepID=A0A438CYX6_VITVI|nr:hypothetical protein CK203_115015 [Vitis vinifera]
MEQPKGCVVPRKGEKGRLSRYTQSPNQDHWTVVSRVLKYLRGTINYGLCYSGFPSVLEGFSGANWILDSDEMKSTNICFHHWWKCIFLDVCQTNLHYSDYYGGVISLGFVRSELNLTNPLTEPRNKKLVEETSRGMGLMSITEVKSGDRAYSTLTKVECLLLMNTIFLMDGRGHTHLCQPFLYNSSVIEKTNVDKGPLVTSRNTGS